MYNAVADLGGQRAESPFQIEAMIATSTAYGSARSLCDRLSPVVQSAPPRFNNPGSATGTMYMNRHCMFTLLTL